MVMLSNGANVRALVAWYEMIHVCLSKVVCEAVVDAPENIPETQSILDYATGADCNIQLWIAGVNHAVQAMG